MSFTKPLEEYKRSPQPALPESQKIWLEQELRKLEKTLELVYQALNELDKRLTTHGW